MTQVTDQPASSAAADDKKSPPSPENTKKKRRSRWWTAGVVLLVIIFVLVVVQMTTALRPIVGKADTFLPKDKKFFLTHWSDSLQAGPAGTPTPSR